jgi:AbrB family looped-hinge helix DNA binding protein
MNKSISRGKTRMGANGRIVIPTDLRSQLGIEPGDTVLMEVDDGVLRIESYPSRVARIQRELAHLRRPEVLASDELITDRREEARRDEEEFRGEMEQERLSSEGKIA